jgi:tetratricopeptide (TPR) repeat protein
MLSYLILLIVLTFFFSFVEKHEQSGTFWTIFLLIICYVLMSVFEQSLFAATLIAGALSVAAVYGFILIGLHFFPRNLFFRLIQDFDRYWVNWFYQIIKGVLHLIAFFVKPAIKIQKHFNKRYQVLANAIQKERWQRVTEIINQADSAQRSLLIASLEDETFKPAHYEKWIKQEPENPLAYLLYGNAMIIAAWEVRGGGTADTIPMSRFDEFWKRLALAQNAFYHAISLDETDPEPFSSLITVAMGLSQGQEALWEYFVQMIKRDRDNYFGHQSMLTALTPKWLGSKEDMFDFTRKIVKHLPKGHVLYGLIPKAHIEQWLYYSMSDDERAHNQYFRVAEHINEINEAFEAYAKGIDRPDETGYYVLNMFAFCFYQQGDLDKTRELLKVIGKQATTYPWYYCTEPLLSQIDTSYAYSKVCQEAGVFAKE